ncbi:MAG: zinc ribbon domain-containing protein, partial [Actinomycetota bacterium]|nr:zinc ribbon domain-containing protein [Actinomycetota bacterium]
MSRQSRHSARARGRARRRLRHLRRLRELQLRDAGGLVFDLYRFGERREALVRAKFDAIIATDKEIRALEELLGESGRDRVLDLRLPGIGGTCPACGEFHASDARFCAGCGTPLAETPAVPPAQPARPQATSAPGHPLAAAAGTGATVSGGETAAIGEASSE